MCLLMELDALEWLSSNGGVDDSEEVVDKPKEAKKHRKENRPAFSLNEVQDFRFQFQFKDLVAVGLNNCQVQYLLPWQEQETKFQPRSKFRRSQPLSQLLNLLPLLILFQH